MPRGNWGRVLPAALLLASLGLVGCAGPRVNLRPLYFRETRPCPERPEQLVTTLEVLHPLFGMESGAGRHYHVVRPFYSYESEGAGATHCLQYLWPLGLQMGRRGASWLHRLWPLFQYSKTHRFSTGEEAVHGMLFPIIFWGRRPNEAPYGALFPVGGVTHGLLGDTFSFVLFPIYSYYQQGSYVRHNVLWPFLGWGGTPDGRQKTLRLWPLYVNKRETDSYSHHYLLWPFIRWGHQQWQGREGPLRRRYSAFHPLFSAQSTRDADGNVLAWQRQILLLTLRHDTRERVAHRGWSALFSLIWSKTTPVKDDFRVFPFYWRTTYYHRGGRGSGEKWTRRRILWPILWVDHSTLEPEREKSGIVLAPFYWHYTTRHTGGRHAGRTGRRITLWPLLKWQKEADGSRHVRILSEIWPSTSEGFERNYGAFFDLFQYHSSVDGERETRALWRLYHHRRGPAGRYLSLAGLFSYDGVGDAGADGRKSVSALFGLVKYYWGDAESRWRLLYVPL